MLLDTVHALCGWLSYRCGRYTYVTQTKPKGTSLATEPFAIDALRLSEGFIYDLWISQVIMMFENRYK